MSQMAGSFAAKLKAGLSVAQVLYALSVESKNLRLVSALKGVKASVDKGQSLGEALCDHPDVFDGMTVALLAAGEKSNRLPIESQRLSAYLGNTGRIERGLNAVTGRWLVGFGVGLLVFLAALAGIVPSVEQTLRDLHMQEWPAATRLAIQTSHAVRSILPVLLVLVALGSVSWHLVMRGERGALRRESLLLQAPVIGSLWRAKAVADFSRTAGVLAAAGIPATDAIEHAALSAGSVAVRGAVVLAMDRIGKGRGLPTALAEVGLISRSEINTMQAAERRGNLGEMLMKHAEASDAQLLRGINRVKHVVQSATILVLSVLVACAILALVGPALLHR